MAFRQEPYPEDVANRIEHDFVPSERDQVAEILFRVNESVGNVPWVQLAALRLANGRIDLLQQWVDEGNADPRDLQLSIESIAGLNWEREYILYGKRG
jgi:hypothetical protein